MGCIYKRLIRINVSQSKLHFAIFFNKRFQSDIVQEVKLMKVYLLEVIKAVY